MNAQGRGFRQANGINISIIITARTCTGNKVNTAPRNILKLPRMCQLMMGFLLLNVHAVYCSAQVAGTRSVHRQRLGTSGRQTNPANNPFGGRLYGRFWEHTGRICLGRVVWYVVSRVAIYVWEQSRVAIYVWEQ